MKIKKQKQTKVQDKQKKQVKRVSSGSIYTAFRNGGGTCQTD